jgi:hypothetical protein
MELKVGDIVRGIARHNDKVRREILEVRPTGYTWRYPDVPDHDFWSENSNDPFFDAGWEVEPPAVPPSTHGEESK